MGSAMRVVIGVTGASGAVFGADFVRQCPGEKYLIMSKWGRMVMREETGLTEHHLAEHVKATLSDEDVSAPFASGSAPFDALVIIPCSASTMCKIAAGIGDTLITRVAQVALKERRQAVVALRETPLSTLMLDQAHRLSQAGAVIMPIMPPMYFDPPTIPEMVRLFTDKVLHVLGEAPVRVWKGQDLACTDMASDPVRLDNA